MSLLPNRPTSANGQRTSGACTPVIPPPVPGNAQVKLSLFGRTVLDLIAFAKQHWDALEDNDLFPDPTPPQDELAAAIADAQAATQEVDLLRTKLRAAVSRRNGRLEKLARQMEQRGNYVQMLSGGDAARILNARLEVRRERQPVRELEPPLNLQVTLNGVAGLAIITWNKVKHARMYLLEYGPEDGPMLQRPITGRRKVELSDLELGKVYQFRIAACGSAAGQSPWSPWVKRRAA